MTKCAILLMSNLASLAFPIILTYLPDSVLLTFVFVGRQKLANFLASVCNADGSFLMHEGGEVDIRGAYCAVAVARLTKLTLHPLFARTPAWIVRYRQYCLLCSLVNSIS